MNTTYKIIFAIITLCSSSVLIAQVPSGPPATPIDGGLSLLLLAGGAYGLKKLKDRKK